MKYLCQKMLIRDHHKRSTKPGLDLHCQESLGVTFGSQRVIHSDTYSYLCNH